MPRISERLHANFTILADWREVFFCYTRFRHGIFYVQVTLLRTVHAFWRKTSFWRESPVVICCSKIRVSQKRRIAFTLNPHFLSKSVNCLRISRHMRLHTQILDNIIRTTCFDRDFYSSEVSILFDSLFIDFHMLL